MRIVKFSAENVKRLKVVEITPTGNVVEITGKNGEGKSSVLDAIWYALGGTDAIPSGVVREGEGKAFVKLDIGDSSKIELIVTRHFLKSGTTRLVVEDPDPKRAAFRSPQKMLDELIGALSFDPLAFARAKSNEQLEALRKLVNLDLSKIDSAIFEASAARKSFAADLKRSEAQLVGIPEPPEATPDEAIDVNQLMRDLEEAGKENVARNNERTARSAKRASAAGHRQLAQTKEKEASDVWTSAEERCRQIMDAANKKRVELLEERDRLKKAAIALAIELGALAEVPDDIDASGLLRKASDAQQINEQVRVKKVRQKLQGEIKEFEEKVAKQEMLLETEREARATSIREAKMPIPDLSFDDNEVLYQGRSLALASDAERLRVSVAIAMAANPKLRVLRVKDGSLLDDDSLKTLTALAAANDYQIWLERVEEGKGRPCVVMQDGSVKE